MKTKVFALVFAVSVAVAAAVSTADVAARERATTVEALPAAAQEFIKTHFGGLTVAFAVEEPKLLGVEYEVTFTDRTEVEFAADGSWKSVDREYSAVPESVVPQKIAAAVANGNWQGQYIKSISKKSRTWEVELSGGLEIIFDGNFNIIGYDD